MGNEVQNVETAEDVAESYADEECLGTLGEVVDVTRNDDVWIVEFRTHTISDRFTHEIEITDRVGNIISHDRREDSA